MSSFERESQLFAAARDNQVAKIKELLSRDDVDVNWGNPQDNQRTTLQVASERGHVDSVLSLLSHPRIDPNRRDRTGETPFLRACFNGSADLVKVLLGDPRVDVNIASTMRCSPLWWLACNGHAECTRWLIASGKDLAMAGGENWLDGDHGKKYMPVDIARRRGKTAIVNLLEEFVEDPDKCTSEIRRLLCLNGTIAILL